MEALWIALGVVAGIVVTLAVVWWAIKRFIGRSIDSVD